MRHDLVLVPLSRDQIAKAKEAHGKRKRITHALLCGPHGQLCRPPTDLHGAHKE